MKFLMGSSRPLDDYSDLSLRREPRMMNESYQHFKVPLVNVFRPGVPIDWTGRVGNQLIMEHLQNVPADEPVLVTDAWDAFFAGTPEEMEKAFLAFGKPLVISTEPNLWPKETAHLMHHPPAPTRFRYACGGGWAGYAGEIVRMLTAPDYWQPPFICNQSAFDDWFCRHQDTTAMDYHCRLFQCLYDDGTTKPSLKGIFDIKDKRLHNKETDSYPLVIHGGGGFTVEAMRLWKWVKAARGI